MKDYNIILKELIGVRKDINFVLKEILKLRKDQVDLMHYLNMLEKESELINEEG